MSTLRDQLEDLSMLHVVRKERVPNPYGRGAPRYLYHITDTVRTYWQQAGLTVDPEVLDLPNKREINRSIRRTRSTKDPARGL